ncbi:MAG: hypothetical protein FJ303_18655 [Planctomycetes bacterium]|nr:hypothetical protein [Planctomycetota bacterium]
MVRCVIGFAATLLAASVAVAALGSPYEQALQQAVDSFEKIAGTLKGIKDEDTAAASKPELRKSALSYLEAVEKASKLPPPEKDEKARLEKLYKAKMEGVLKRISTEYRRVELIDGEKVKDALKELDVIFPRPKKS